MNDKITPLKSIRTHCIECSGGSKYIADTCHIAEGMKQARIASWREIEGTRGTQGANDLYGSPSWQLLIEYLADRTVSN